MALAYDARRATRDIDAVFQPKEEVYAAAAVVAAHGLDLVESVYPGRAVMPKVQFLLEEFFGPTTP